jgi:hypothetical protein
MQVGRALSRLGIEHIPGYSPQGRGRGERLNRTQEGRLINPRGGHHHGRDRQRLTCGSSSSPTMTPSSRGYWRTRRRPSSLAVDPDLNLCHEEERTVGLDNVVDLEGVPLQLTKQPGRRIALDSA